jgi:triosephosphate isomerase
MTTDETVMTARPKPLIAGNWKMNGLRASGAELKAMIDGYDEALAGRADLLVCPPATLAMGFARVAADSRLSVGGQDCHARKSGAHTGDVSAEMLADCGCTHVIVGHSERRADHGETDAVVRAKAGAAVAAGLTAIICIGETEAEKDAGRTIEVVSGQLAGSLPEAADPARVVIAYEPVWAIGSGRTPTAADVAAVHGAIRNALVARFSDAGEGVRILYGGSVKPSNAAELLAVADVDGALVGGASLKAADLLAIARAAPTRG